MTNKTTISANNPKRSSQQPKITEARLLASLNFDDTTQQIEALKDLIFNAKDSNHTKIQFIKEALSAGRYEIHNDHIATKLMAGTTVEEAPELA